MLAKQYTDSIYSVPAVGNSTQNSDRDVFSDNSCHPQGSSSPPVFGIPINFSKSDTCRSGPVSPHELSNEQTNVLKKLDAIKAWSINTLKCTKQVIEEKLGTTAPTCDEKLDLRIQTLRQMQKQYRLLLDNIRHFSVCLTKMVLSQRQLAGQLATLGQQQFELTDSFAHNAETQRLMATNGEKLLCALETVCSGLSTLVHHTFDDTMLTIKHMNIARIEFDAYRKEAEASRAAAQKANLNDPNCNHHADEAMAKLGACEAKFLQRKSAVDAKLRLLHENRIRVMQHHLQLLHNATHAYSSGHVAMLDDTLKRFNVKLVSPVKSRLSSTDKTSPVSVGGQSSFGQK